MKILSIRQGFASDHSSTSYEFLSVDKPLNKKDRSEVSKLSSRVHPTARRANFIYHVDGYDIPGGWEKLMERYYDVMYSESYDWWTLAMAFNAAPGQHEEIRVYDFVGVDELGIGILGNEQRIIVTIHCAIDSGCMDNEYYDDDDYEYEEADDEDALFETSDELLNILTQIRNQLISGDYRALYAVWEKYGNKEDENPPPKPNPKNLQTGEEIIKKFKNMLNYIG